MSCAEYSFFIFWKSKVLMHPSLNGHYSLHLQFLLSILSALPSQHLMSHPASNILTPPSHPAILHLKSPTSYFFDQARRHVDVSDISYHCRNAGPPKLLLRPKYPLTNVPSITSWLRNPLSMEHSVARTNRTRLVVHSDRPA